MYLISSDTSNIILKFTIIVVHNVAIEGHFLAHSKSMVPWIQTNLTIKKYVIGRATHCNRV